MIPNESGYPDPNTPARPRSAPRPIAGRIEAAPSAPHREGAAPPSVLTAGPDFGGLLRSLARRWMLAVVLGVPLAIGAAAGAWYLLAPRATAVAMVRVLAQDPGNPFDADRGGSSSSFITMVRSYASQLKSQSVITDALKRDEVRRFDLDSVYSNPVADIMLNELKVETSDQSEFITATLTGQDPEATVAVLQAIVNTFMEKNVYEEKEKVKKILSEWQNTMNDKKRTVIRLKKLLETQLKDDEADGGIQRLTFLQNELFDVKRQRSLLQVETIKARGALESFDVQSKLVSEPGKLSPAMITEAENRDPEVARLKDRVRRVEESVRGVANPSPSDLQALERLAYLKVDLGKRRQEVRAEIESRAETPTNPNSAAAIAAARKSQVNTIASLEAQIGKNDEDIALLTGKLEKMRKVNADREGLEAEIKLTEDVVSRLGDQIQRRQTALNSGGERVFPYQKGDLQKSDAKKQILGAAVTPLGVLALVCFWVASREYRLRRINNAGEIARGLGIRVVGAVPNLPNLEHHLMCPAGEPEMEGHPALESIDSLRTLLLMDSEEGVSRIVMVTSAVSGEGKTTLASHLATSLARAGRRTLLIDGDLRAPAVHQLFEVPMQPGFSEVLLAEVEITDAIQETTLDGLAVMPAGQWDRVVLQALAREGLEGIFEKLRQEYDFVIIDSHPVLAANDSLLIGQRVDGVILSVLRKVSQMPRVYAANQKLNSVGIHFLGAVVNAADPDEIYNATGLNASLVGV